MQSNCFHGKLCDEFIFPLTSMSLEQKTFCLFLPIKRDFILLRVSNQETTRKMSHNMNQNKKQLQLIPLKCFLVVAD